MRVTCVVCDDRGCEFCSRIRVEPWPSECFTDLKDEELERLIVDTQLELDRRAIRLHDLEHLWGL